MHNRVSGVLDDLLEVLELVPGLQNFLHVLGFFDDEDVAAAVVQDELVHRHAVGRVEPNGLKKSTVWGLGKKSPKEIKKALAQESVKYHEQKAQLQKKPKFMKKPSMV